MKIGVIGAGAWGSALYYALKSAGNEMLITSRSPKDLPDFTTLDEVLKCDYILMAISTQVCRNWLKDNFTFSNQKFLIASKGIDITTHQFLDEIYGAHIPKANLAFISGPSFAKEVNAHLPTALVISSTNETVCDEWRTLFPKFIKTYISADVKGAEIAGAYKNVIAIAAGVSEALGLGNNARAALITRGLAEMERFGKLFGADERTFLGLSGVGDLFLTATSELSRNYRVGVGLGKGKHLEEILNELGEVAEGVPTAKAIVAICQEKNVYAPIAKEVLSMIEGKGAQESLQSLLSANQSYKEF